VTTGRPRQSVVSQARTWIVPNTKIVRLAALKRLVDIGLVPTTNKWRSHTPVPTTAVRIVDQATSA
jgi:hypothetical protein